MSMPLYGPTPSTPTPLRWRVVAWLVVQIAYVLSKVKPVRLRRVLTAVRTGARPARLTEAQRALDAVLSASVRCTGEYCLQRAIAVALLCRVAGSWPEWRAGVRTEPFQAHAWVVAEGVAVGENPATIGYFSPLIVIGPDDRPARTAGATA